jgi:two-component system response regulator YesN
MKIMEHLKSNYSKALSLEELSRLVDYTPQYLSSLFSNEVGMSIQEFLQRLRIEEACRLLSCTDLPVAEIAAAVGYRDTRHFSKVFRRYQTISPKEYRKATETQK